MIRALAIVELLLLAAVLVAAYRQARDADRRERLMKGLGGKRPSLADYTARVTSNGSTANGSKRK